MLLVKLTSDEKSRIAKFFGTPEWAILEGFFIQLLGSINKVTDIGQKSDKISIEQEVVARQILVEKLTEFLQDLSFIKNSVPKQPRRDTSE